MQQMRLMFLQFLKEPLWFKILIPTTLLISIVFSSSLFAENAIFQVYSKLAAAIFFCAYGIKFRSNLEIFLIFFTLAGICIFLSIQAR